MKKKQQQKDFDFYIDEYMYYCRSKHLRPKTMQSYEQTLRLFERWCQEELEITEPGQVLEATVRRYICSLQERGKYTFYSIEEQTRTNCPERRRDYRQLKTCADEIEKRQESPGVFLCFFDCLKSWIFQSVWMQTTNTGLRDFREFRRFYPPPWPPEAISKSAH